MSFLSVPISHPFPLIGWSPGPIISVIKNARPDLGEQLGLLGASR